MSRDSLIARFKVLRELKLKAIARGDTERETYWHVRMMLALYHL